ncbi:hypothetical protein JRO89_XS02G0104900 [Xanthoceras sorbifolium]|uniref:Retrotransposon Copia-like N-terminal domain-containing protein n=1 Tax=Xanthoceras sorbifolium TaxID=99658 RepID=A0ABQ8IFJ9_9ROSI|nr:hypothetical protein JRO89_XS02G0104900 [Xanthoceras sorbifolium]
MALGNQNPNNNVNRFQPLTPPSASNTLTLDYSSIDNIHSPFFLHNGDHPGLALVSHILTGPNYNTWSRAMLMALNAKNKLGFVDGLNEYYAGTRGQILMLDPLLSVSKVFNLVVQEERQLSIGLISSTLADFLAFNASSAQPVLPTPPAPYTSASLSQNKPKRDRPICSYCGITGHFVDRCYKLHGYPPGYKPMPKSQAQ